MRRAAPWALVYLTMTLAFTYALVTHIQRDDAMRARLDACHERTAP